MLASLAAADVGAACDFVNVSGARTFPIEPNIGARYLKDANGLPFFMSGDSPWSLIADLTSEEADLYLRDRHDRGFNTLLVNLIEHKFARNAPANAYGDAPFLVDGDFTEPNPAYFDHALQVLERACELGFLVLLAPSYAGWGGGDDGWYSDMISNGDAGLRAYGRFVGETFGHLDNIIWTHGGDFYPPEKYLVRAMVDGINETDPNALHTAHGTPEADTLDYWAEEPWLAINNFYHFQGRVYEAAHRQYRRFGERPFFFMEGAYENEHGAGGAEVRLQAYQAVLSGATGHLFGNNPIWHFGGPGLWPQSGTWQEALDSPGSNSMTRLHDLVSGLEWWRLEPDMEGRLLRVGRGTRTSRAVAARADDGSFALVYLPSRRRFVVDLSELGSEPVKAVWYDPTTGASISEVGSPFEARWQSFEPPARNGAGDFDWVLVLTGVRNGAHSVRFDE